MDMFSMTQELLAKQLRLDPAVITRESRIKDDLGADSLDVLQILLTIEEEKGIRIPDDSLASLVTVGDVVNYMESL